MTNFTVAAEQAKQMRSNAVRSAARETLRTPGGTCHAVAPNSNTTVCRLLVADLEPFTDIVFGVGSLLDWCRKCQQDVSAA